MLSVYVLIAIIILVVWRYGYKKFKSFLTRKRTVVNELKRQREEIKLTSDELRQPMARMTTIIGNLAEKETDLEGREQLNSLHFQMLQVITRISEMQTVLENPEAKAESTAKDRLELNDQGEIALPAIASSELSADIQPLRLDKKTQKFNVVFIDDNQEFCNFMNAHLREVYDFHVYNDVKIALEDIESMMADLVIGKTKDEALALADIFDRMIKGEVTEEDLEQLDEAAALQDISHMPARVKCAMLGWRTMKEMLGPQ